MLIEAIIDKNIKFIYFLKLNNNKIFLKALSPIKCVSEKVNKTK